MLLRRSVVKRRSRRVNGRRTSRRNLRTLFAASRKFSAGRSNLLRRWCAAATSCLTTAAGPRNPLLSVGCSFHLSSLLLARLHGMLAQTYLADVSHSATSPCAIDFAVELEANRSSVVPRVEGLVVCRRCTFSLLACTFRRLLLLGLDVLAAA